MATDGTLVTKLSGLSERSFVRRFAKATEMKAIDYIHALRLEAAKELLETSDLAVEGVANEVGYEDASFLGVSSAARSGCRRRNIAFVSVLSGER